MEPPPAAAARCHLPRWCWAPNRWPRPFLAASAPGPRPPLPLPLRRPELAQRAGYPATPPLCCPSYPSSCAQSETTSSRLDLCSRLLHPCCSRRARLLVLPQSAKVARRRMREPLWVALPRWLERLLWTVGRPFPIAEWQGLQAVSTASQFSLVMFWLGARARQRRPQTIMRPQPRRWGQRFSFHSFGKQV